MTESVKVRAKPSHPVHERLNDFGIDFARADEVLQNVDRCVERPVQEELEAAAAKQTRTATIRNQDRSHVSL